jgi:hypothetical protein
MVFRKREGKGTTLGRDGKFKEDEYNAVSFVWRGI